MRAPTPSSSGGWQDKDLAAIEAAADEAALPIAGFSAGGTLTDPGAADDAVATIRESIRTAADLDASMLIATTGPDQDGLDRVSQYDNIVDVLSRVAPDVENAGVTLALEVDIFRRPLEVAQRHRATTDQVDGERFRKPASDSPEFVLDVLASECWSH